MLDILIKPNSGQPIYRQIAEHVCNSVEAGQLTAGQKLPSMSALARELGVSPLTINRSYEYLAEQGIVKQKHGSGTYIQAQAVSQVGRHGKRAVEHLYVILGHDSLAQCHNATLFIVADILSGVMEILGQRHTHLVYVKTLDDAHLSEVGPDDAVLIRSAIDYDPLCHADLLKRQIRVASMWEVVPSPMANTPNVSVDFQQTDRLPCEHLVACGYQKIGFIGRCAPDPGTITRKFVTYCDVLRHAGLDIHTRFVRNATVTPGQAYAAVYDMTKDGKLPDAIYVDTDYKAMEVITALNEMGLRVPQDIGIASYDDIPEAQRFSPPLTTVSTPRRAIGQQLGHMFQNWPTDGSLPESQKIESKLIVRASTNALPTVASGDDHAANPVDEGVLLPQS